ncbi:hypothetical protein C8R46DRAFT_1217023 [Mycena filopes]|nr:hypothetical protein C8R46DRAFT_1217023 [Mycena filopes]
MSLHDPEHSATTLSHSSEKPRHAQSPESPRRVSRWAAILRLRGKPALIICGQILLQIAAWGFFAVVRARGFLAVPQIATGGFKAIAWFSTQVSTYIAAFSSL